MGSDPDASHSHFSLLDAKTIHTEVLMSAEMAQLNQLLGVYGVLCVIGSFGGALLGILLVDTLSRLRGFSLSRRARNTGT